MYELMKKLFPICRSITGDGVRQTLREISEIIPIEVHEIPTGTKVFDWVIPDEWNIRDAYIKNSDGERVVDFKQNNLHVFGYSVPFEGRLSLDKLQDNLYSLKDMPDAIPYLTSYYKRSWGFCISENSRNKLVPGEYDVKIDSSLEPGSLTYADIVIKGKSKKEILFSTYICHPSMANNELSGPVVATFLAKYLLEKNNLYYTYRFIFIPETIGAVTYLSKHHKHLKRNVVAGYVITCVGDPGVFSYLQTRQENTLSDRIAKHVLRKIEGNYNLYSYACRGSDERQYCAPGIDLPIGSLMRTKYGEFDQYHTSLDDLSFVTSEGLDGSLDKYIKCVECLEENHIYKIMVLCEPQLVKRDLRSSLGSRKNKDQYIYNMMNILAYCDGEKDLLWIAEKIDVPMWDLVVCVQTLEKHKLLIRTRSTLIDKLIRFTKRILTVRSHLQG